MPIFKNKQYPFCITQMLPASGKLGNKFEELGERLSR